MFTLNRIFWKVFSAIWLSNILILALTFFVINEARLKNEAQNRFEDKFSPAVVRVIDQREQGLFGVFGHPPSHRQKIELPRLKNKPIKFLILDADNALFFATHRKFSRAVPIMKLPSWSDAQLKNARLEQFSVQSKSGKRYQVYYQRPPAPKIFERFVKPFLSLHILLMVIVSAFMSGLLSWRITRPLKQLSHFSHTYTVNKGNSVEVALPLLSRGDEIGELAQGVSHMAERARAAYDAQKNLLHDVSHELRAPLARLQVAAMLIEQQEDKKLYIDKINTECQRVDALIQSILDYSRIDQEHLAIEEFDFSILVKGVVDDLRFEYPEREINTKIPSNIIMHGSEGLLHRAIENILRNACKYTPEDTPINLVCEVERGQVKLTVRDYGPGIRSHELDTIFKPFYRSGNQMHTEGFGLGLSLVKRAIEKHGGQVTVGNAEPSGLVVTICLSAAV